MRLLLNLAIQTFWYIINAYAEKATNASEDTEGGIGTIDAPDRVLGKLKREGVGDKNYPPKPVFSSMSYSEKVNTFGKFKYRILFAVDKDAIEIADDWVEKNIIKVYIKQLDGVRMWEGKTCDGYIRLHRLIAHQFVGFFNDIEKEGLSDLILSFSGSFYPRFMRGTNQKTLSNHSWGTAIDINVEWNELNKPCALVGEKGSVRELVEIGHRWGIYWGGHFSRLDGMHFEIYKIIEK